MTACPTEAEICPEVFNQHMWISREHSEALLHLWPQEYYALALR